MMTTKLFRLALIPVWAAGLWGSLQVHQMDLNLGHDVCGPWGCGPRVEALIGFHGFWLFLMAPVAIGAGAFLPGRLNRKVGRAILFAGLAGVVGFVGWDVISYAREAESSRYLFQRGLFTLVTTVDFPMLQTLLAGGVLATVFGRKSPPGSEDNSGATASPDANTESESAALAT